MKLPPVHAAGHGERAASLLQRRDLGHVGEAGDLPEGPADAHDKNKGAESQRSRAERRADGDDADQRRTGDHGALVAPLRDGEPCRDVADDLADAAQRDDERGEGKGSAELAGEERDGRDDDALTDREEDCREVDAEGQGAESKRLLFLSLLVRHGGTLR